MSIALFLAVAASALTYAEQTAADGARSQRFTVEIAAARGDVWTALTTAEGWQRWAVRKAWLKSATPLVIETSYDPEARPGGPQTIVQQFDKLEAPTSLSFRTTKAPAGFEGFETYRNVVSSFTLSPSGPNTTKLTFESGPFPDTAEGRKLFAFFRDGNEKTMEQMARALSADD